MKDKRRAWLKNLLLFTQLGLSVVSPILVCVFIGWLAQSQLGAPSWVMLICIFVGVASGLVSAWRLLQKMLRISNGEDAGSADHKESKDQSEKEEERR